LKKIALSLLLFATSSFGFVSLAPLDIDSKKGTKVQLALSVNISKGNTDKESYQGSTDLRYHSTDWTMFLLGAYTYGVVNGDKNTNKGLLHARLVHVFPVETLDYELFVQGEFNQFQNLKDRDLAGANLRTHIPLLTDFYIGAGALYEYIAPDTRTEADQVRKTYRVNTYISAREKFNENLTLNYLGYYQPAFGDINDFRITQTLQFSFKIVKEFSFKVEGVYRYNSRPYSGVLKEDWSMFSGLAYKF